ncbi:TatD DNase [Saprolegnia diclina VS20]|uniref:TatD DNase n=1 Tax=Saprolegnia diclina (strain VS20) TaxID=1156394 RepID=T0Q880_SAPDV|nr:TatD DNase [Saprolegnia diclina VS20]EQC34069.1 TatD DNase [Saprolegnia diclina VS20]|eukprot:XP_008612381.1 TatD DNase [Saprolegnia diclina VS20]
MTSLRLIDIGANLTDPMFVGNYRGKQKHESDLRQVLDRAFANHVEKIIVTGGSLSESKEALRLARTHEKLHCTVGVHPTRCSEFLADPDAYMAELTQVCRDGMSDKKVVAVGEFGLDYDRLEFCPKDVQQTYFTRQFELARATKLPLFLHNRNTGSDFTDMIRRHRDDFTDGVVHSFTGSKEEAQALLDLGLYIGINGCSLKTAENLDVVKMIPSDQLMLETDAPWCDIRPTHAGYSHVQTTFPTKKMEKFVLGECVKGRNEPCTMLQVLEVVSGVRGDDIHELAATVYDNTQRVFFRS